MRVSHPPAIEPGGEPWNHRPRRSWWHSALLALLPSAIVLVLAGVSFGAAPQDFLPVWNDEVVYWNEAAVFAHAGFDGGYITAGEQTASATFSRFGPHGPAFAVFHGSIGRVFGWAPYSAFLVNLAVISMSAFAWLHLSGAGSSRTAPLIGALFWPLLLYLPTNMQEPTHFALAFLFALAIDRLRRRASASTYAWTAVLLAVAAFIRPTWALMILPLGWRRARDAGPWAVTGLLVLTLAIAAVAWGTFGVLASPFQNSMQQLVAAWREAPERAPETILNKTTLNLRLWFTTTEDEPPEIVFRCFLALFMTVLIVRRAVASIRPRGETDTLELCALIVAPVLIIVIGFGQVESWRDFRLLSPHVLAALLVAADVRWARWLWGATLVFLPLYYQEFVEFHEERFTSNPSSIGAMRDATVAAAPFVPGASPWRNTVVAPIGLVQYPLLGLPRGIGISYVIDWSDMSRVQSGYVLLGPEDRAEAEALVRLVPIAETPLGTLYRNANAVIDPDPEGR